MQAKEFDLSTVDGCFDYFIAHTEVVDTSHGSETCSTMRAFYNGTADFHNQLTSSQKVSLSEKVVKYIQDLKKEYDHSDYIGSLGYCYIYESILLQKAGLSKPDKEEVEHQVWSLTNSGISRVKCCDNSDSPIKPPRFVTVNGAFTLSDIIDEAKENCGIECRDCGETSCYYCDLQIDKEVGRLVKYYNQQYGTNFQFP